MKEWRKVGIGEETGRIHSFWNHSHDLDQTATLSEKLPLTPIKLTVGGEASHETYLRSSMNNPSSVQAAPSPFAPEDTLAKTWEKVGEDA
ncbi:hypothetical protein MJO28_005310 [Puccinia striiformis f. sp. tritici]|uniref:Uncharacterized protein n=1 Tax=Puccinia striiformis f. sp. tritici TaxID=168172 RepID=A0ACC0EKC1_9BASI|nr:hypothetical protein MJO28_005310 [Puccinia striiformis f. sp. tritici]KAI7960280.1 hypothetical protein MJO29_005348 [Puccinia striiformis f. sp. tritici]